MKIAVIGLGLIGASLCKAIKAAHRPPLLGYGYRCRNFGEGVSAGSFQDLTRVARLNEHMRTQLCTDNKLPLLAEIDTLMENLQAYKTAPENEDEEMLMQLLRTGRELKEESLKHDVHHSKQLKKAICGTHPI